jgi:hypothetical protein
MPDIFSSADDRLTKYMRKQRVALVVIHAWSIALLGGNAYALRASTSSDWRATWILPAALIAAPVVGLVLSFTRERMLFGHTRLTLGALVAALMVLAGMLGPDPHGLYLVAVACAGPLIVIWNLHVISTIQDFIEASRREVAEVERHAQVLSANQELLLAIRALHVELVSQRTLMHRAKSWTARRLRRRPSPRADQTVVD